jgi:multidrug efflux pump subunit AcrA (membrane-fusion protein)
MNAGKALLPVIAIIGVSLAIYTVRASSRHTPSAPPVAAPAVAPFESYIAGAGLVEPQSENIAIGTLVGGVVQEVMVSVGDRVSRGQPLFRIDDRDLRALVMVRQAGVEAAKLQLRRLEAFPRPEDLPPLEARVRQAQAEQDHARREFVRLAEIRDDAISRDERERARLALETADARLASAQAELDRVRAGAWRPDVEIARAQLGSAQAELHSAQVALDRLTVRAPVDATVLQVRVRPGEFAPAGIVNNPLMLLGQTDTLHIRVDIDENDAWRLTPGARARAFLRGNSALATDVQFVRVEPYVVPKRSLTGETSERVDTRVLQVIFSFPRDSLPIYVGQQMDVFVEANASGVVGTMPEE